MSDDEEVRLSMSDLTAYTKELKAIYGITLIEKLACVMTERDCDRMQAVVALVAELTRTT